MAKRQSRPVEVLLGEDNPGDALRTRTLLDDGAVPGGVFRVTHVARLESAVRHLARGEAPLADEAQLRAVVDGLVGLGPLELPALDGPLDHLLAPLLRPGRGQEARP